jgi:uncharacterized protein YgbK (DUF1537 family)
MLGLAVIADDITGAADTGVQFLPAFAPIYLLDHRLLSLKAVEPPPQAISVFTSSRGLTPVEAGRVALETGRAIRGFHPERVYKKIDSALRGHIGAELEAMMEVLDLPFSFIVPAFPEQGRVTVGGVHRIHGVPVAETEMGRDPVTPVTESLLPKWIGAQTRWPVAHVGVAVIDAGIEAVAAEIERQRSRGVRHIGFDATGAEHLNRIARLALNRCAGPPAWPGAWPGSCRRAGRPRPASRHPSFRRRQGASCWFAARPRKPFAHRRRCWRNGEAWQSRPCRPLPLLAMMRHPSGKLR